MHSMHAAAPAGHTVHLSMPCGVTARGVHWVGGGASVPNNVNRVRQTVIRTEGAVEVATLIKYAAAASRKCN